jgi:hypothetical protein
MLRETKFGYGFLLVGTAMPYLIDKIFGLTAAILVSVVCLVAGGVLLWSGHKHSDGILLPVKGWKKWGAFGAACCTLIILLTVGFRRAAQNESGTTEASKNLEDPPAISVLYEPGKIRVFNTGRTSIAMWGFSYGDAKTVETDSREIAPGFNYYLEAPDLEKQFLEHMKVGQEGFTPCRVFVELGTRKYTVNCLLVAKKDTDTRAIIHTQMVKTVEGWD